MSCNTTTLLQNAGASGFTGLSDRELKIAVLEMLCEGAASGPQVTVSAKGVVNGGSTITNNGCDFGPDTTGTTTSGIQEAFNSLFQAATSSASHAGGGLIQLQAGQFDCTGQITIPSAYPYNLTVRGAGKMATVVNYTGTTVQDFVIATASAGAEPTLNLTIEDCGWTYEHDTNKAAIFNFYQSGAGSFCNQVTFNRCFIGPFQMLQFTGIGAAIVFLTGYPKNKVGVVGVISDGTNIISFDYCDFYGLALGVNFVGDHNRMSNCFIGNISTYWLAGIETQGNQYSTVLNNQDANVLAIGPGVVAGGSDTILTNCQFHHNNASVMPRGPFMLVRNPFYETSVWDYLLDPTRDGGSLTIEQSSIFTSVDIGTVNINTGAITASEPAGIITQVWGLGTDSLAWKIRYTASDLLSLDTSGNVTALAGFKIGSISWTKGVGSPEGAVAAPVGSLFSRTDGGATTSLYVKTSGAATSAGWTAK